MTCQSIHKEYNHRQKNRSKNLDWVGVELDGEVCCDGDDQAVEEDVEDERLVVLEANLPVSPDKHVAWVMRPAAERAGPQVCGSRVVPELRFQAFQKNSVAQVVLF